MFWLLVSGLVLDLATTPYERKARVRFLQSSCLASPLYRFLPLPLDTYNGPFMVANNLKASHLFKYTSNNLK